MSDAMPDEQWLPVVDYKGLYEVSDRGRVWSVQRTITERTTKIVRLVGGRMLTIGHDETGRPRVGLSRGGQYEMRYVHQLVMEAFVGARPKELQVCHWDGNPANNHLSNLRYDTSGANKRDAVRHGTWPTAARTHCPRGHRLAAPNLVRSKTLLGHRNCLACARATGMIWHRDKRGCPHEGMQIESDRSYGIIMRPRVSWRQQASTPPRRAPRAGAAAARPGGSRPCG